MTSRLKNYQPTQEIGKGGYGVVYKGKNVETGDIVAIKKMVIAEGDEGVKNSAIREVAISKAVNHPNCVRMLDAIADPQDNAVYCIYEFMPMDLRSYLRQNPRLTEDAVRRIVRQVLEGLGYLHRCDIIHRDVKPHNVLIDPQTLKCKVIDFGLARQFSTQPTAMSCSCGTKFFLAPEMMLGNAKYTKAVDVWGAGLIMSQLFCNKYVFPCKENEEGLMRIYELLGSPTGAALERARATPRWDARYEGHKAAGVGDFLGSASETARDLFAKLCDIDWTTRITCDEALKHPWFSEQGVE